MSRKCSNIMSVLWIMKNILYHFCGDLAQIYIICVRVANVNLALPVTSTPIHTKNISHIIFQILHEIAAVYIFIVSNQLFSVYLPGTSFRRRIFSLPACIYPSSVRVSILSFSAPLQVFIQVRTTNNEAQVQNDYIWQPNTYILQPTKYFIFIADRSRNINNCVTKYRCSTNKDMIVVLGPYKFSFQATIDNNGPSKSSGHYTISANCCKNTLFQWEQVTEFQMIGTNNSCSSYVVIYGTSSPSHQKQLKE